MTEPNYKNSELFRTDVGRMILARLQKEMQAAKDDDLKMDEVVKKYYAAHGWILENIKK